jgi:hypothetical protein
MREISRNRWARVRAQAQEISVTPVMDLQQELNSLRSAEISLVSQTAGVTNGQLAADSGSSTAVLEETVEQFNSRRARERAERIVGYGLTGADQAKLASEQSKVLVSEEAQRALRVEVHQNMDHGVKTEIIPSRVGIREIRLMVKTDGTLASLDGPCLCGSPKRQWHAICLRGENHAA